MIRIVAIDKNGRIPSDGVLRLPESDHPELVAEVAYSVLNYILDEPGIETEYHYEIQAVGADEGVIV